METKKQFRWFSIFEYEKEQDYLREMHRSGYKFVRVKGFGTYHFEKCDPADVVYQLDYNKEGLANKEEYLQMFEDCGWEYLQDYAGYSYFRKPVSESGVAEEIFCDDDSRLQMMERVIKGRMLPLLILFFCVLLPQLVNNLFALRNYLVAAFLGGIIAVYVVVFAYCAVKYINYRDSVRK
ncbi:MAG: DUF2812 domain-containing protein [Clostridia bacterium]|nr:DUF2812 domain-containing protein [Clostridia bacterium]MBQ9993500.1 DUF2812 domain-containing protein [Clostridia bacterium]